MRDLMTVEFALRPRIRLREGHPSARPSRVRLPRFLLPAAAYWLAIAGLTYGFVSSREALLPSSGTPSPSPDSAPPAPRAWWQPLPQAPEPAAAPMSAPRLDAPEPPPSEPPPSEPAPSEAHASDASREATVSPPPSDDRFERALRGVDRDQPEPSRSALARAPRSAVAASRVPAANTADGEPLASEAPRAPSSPWSPPEPDQAAEPTAPALRPAVPSSGRELPSCEAAVASANQELDFSGGNRTADLPSQAIAAVLENGIWLSGCQVPQTTSVDVCVAIRGGAVVGASVSTNPRDGALSACVRRRAAGLKFPFSARLDVARTHF